MAAAAAALTVCGGSATMLVALVAAPGEWWRGYVSEAGTSGQPYAVAYRWGLVVLAAGVALLGVARRPDGTRGPGGARWVERHGRWLAAVTPVLLAAAATLAATSGVVPCTDRCPLPPYEPTTVADVVHTVASAAGLVVLAAAMGAVWATGPHRAERWLAAVAALTMVPLGLALGTTMLAAGRVPTGAVLERLVLVIAVSWLVGTALVTALRR